MEKISAFFGIVLILIALFVLLIIPGFFARLIFRRINKSKLANFSALPLTFYLFSSDDITGMLKAFSEGYGHEDFNAIKWLILFQFFFTFVISKYFARLGIEAGDKLLNKITSSKRKTDLRIQNK